MRVYLLSVALPAAALLAASCSPSDDTTMSEADSAETPAPAAEPAAEAETAPVETAAADTPPAAPAAAAMSDEAMEAAETAVALRQATMRLMVFNFGPVGGMLRGSVPFDAAVVEKNTGRIAALAEMVPGAFAEDTTGVDGLETEALDSIWTNKADFDAHAATLGERASAAAEAAAGGDEAAIRAALGPIGQACGGCHDDFRAE